MRHLCVVDCCGGKIRAAFRKCRRFWIIGVFPCCWHWLGDGGAVESDSSMQPGKKIRRHRLRLDMLAQPDDVTCGPTCLHAVYRYYGDTIPLERVIAEVPRLESGGTLGVLLGRHALSRGYRVTLFTYNLKIFDPTWFNPDVVDLSDRLEAQARFKRSERLRLASTAYCGFIREGGIIRFEVLKGALIRRYLNCNIPILTGLSSTYLYQCAREFGPDDDSDDIRGVPAGHFVVLSGYDRKAREVVVADPLQSNPHSLNREYSIDINRVLSSILLGVLTYDGNLLIVEKPEA
jgi:hypothetical protein